jgi:uncharacterized membrane protein YcaP (DUF421 family)
MTTRSDKLQAELQTACQYALTGAANQVGKWLAGSELMDMLDQFNQLIGEEPKDFTFWQMSARAVIVYLSTILMVRVGHKRFMGRNTAFDIILGFILGSVMSRGINGSAAFLPTLGAGAVLIAMHWICSWIAFHSGSFERFVKGKAHQLIKGGKLIEEELPRHHITKTDLEGALRQSFIQKIEDAEAAFLENSGDISVVPKRRE